MRPVRIAGERPVGSDQGVLGGLLGITRVAQHPECDRIQAVLVGQDQRLERAVEVLGEGADQGAVGVHSIPRTIGPRDRCKDTSAAANPHATGACPSAPQHATIRPTMRLDDRFDELIDTLAGFHRTWLVYLGVELGLFAQLRAAGRDRPDHGRTGTAGRLCHGADRGVGLGRGCPRTRGTRRATASCSTRTRRWSCSTRPGRNSSAGNSSTRWSPRSTGAGMLDFFRTGEPITRAPGSLATVDRAADRPGRRGLLPGGPRRASATGQ